MPENEDPTEDIDPADLDDLGDLGGDKDDEPDEDAPPYVAPDAETWAKIQRKLARQEERITRLTGKTPKGKPVADVDKALADQLRTKGKPAEDEDEQDGEAARWRGIAVQQAAASQLQAAGFSGTAKAAARLARLIDTDGLEPDRSGTFDLEDQIDELREEYPDLFGGGTGSARRPAPVVRRGDSRARPAKDPTRSTSDAMLRAAGLPVGRR